jgi:glycosyltransferase involved in cell wall biosynthesis
MKLSVIISNRNDSSMLVVTIRSAIEELKFLSYKDSEIIIVDNSDPKIYNLLSGYIPRGYIDDGKVKLIRQDFPGLFRARETAIANASGEYIICLDSHMIVGHNCFKDLVEFMGSRVNDKQMGFAHAPISWAHQHERMARHDRDMSVCELGNWGAAYKYPQKMTWKGMPWICRRDWWSNRLGGYGALSEHNLSWGGGDMHIGIKPWLLGFANWAVPTSPCIHIGPFPDIKGVKVGDYVRGMDKYRLYGHSGKGPVCLGFLVSFYVLGGDDMVKRNMKSLNVRFGKYFKPERHLAEARRLAANERKWLDSKRVMSFNQLLRSRPWDQEIKNSKFNVAPGQR